VNVPFKLPPFEKFHTVLNKAGIDTGTARGFWGGVTKDGDLVVTSWLDGHDDDGRFYVWRPKTNHGGLKDQWEVGNIRIGTEVHLILLRQKGNVPVDKQGRIVAGAVLMPGKWRVVKLETDKQWQALIEPVSINV
jgi:hypothetical protein